MEHLEDMMPKLRHNTHCNQVLYLLVIFLLWFNNVLGNEMVNDNMLKMKSLDGSVFKYILVAYDDFLINENNIENYSIRYLKKKEEIEIIFVPEFSKEEGLVLGGRTANGRVVHYHISLSNYQIIRKHYAR